MKEDKIILADKKSLAGKYTYGTIIDDGLHNINDILKENLFNYIYLKDYYHNINFNNERVIRINNILEVFKLIPLYAAKNIDNILSCNTSKFKKEILN